MLLRPSARPAGLHEEAVLFAEVAGGWSDDSSFADYNFAVLLDGLPDVVFTYELGRFLITRWRLLAEVLGS